MQQPNNSTPINKGTYLCGNTENGYFNDLVGHCAGSAERVASGEELLDILTKNCGETHCIRTWVHAQHAWLPNSQDGQHVDGGFGRGGNGAWTGFYGIDANPQPAATEEGGRKHGGRSLTDLQTAITANRIRFCRPCRIYVYGCEVATIGSFATRLSQITGCAVYAAQGKCSTTHADGSDGTSQDPWLAEGGWDKYDNGQKTPIGKKYITPETSW